MQQAAQPCSELLPHPAYIPPPSLVLRGGFHLHTDRPRKAVAVYCVVSTRFVNQMASICTRRLGSDLGLSAVHLDNNGLTPTATFRGRWRSELGCLPVITGPAHSPNASFSVKLGTPYNCVDPPIFYSPEARSSVYTKEFGLIQRRQVKSSSLLLCSSPKSS